MLKNHKFNIFNTLGVFICKLLIFNFFIFVFRLHLHSTKSVKIILNILLMETTEKDFVENKEGTQKIADFSFPTNRPLALEADVVRFQNKKDKWIAFIGLIDGKPYEIFTGLLDDEDGIAIPRWVDDGLIIKNKEHNGASRYDFQYKNTRGYKTTIEGLSHRFNPEYWNYAKLISGTLRHGMPIEKVVELINSLQLDGNINNWLSGVAKALKRYVPGCMDEEQDKEQTN